MATDPMKRNKYAGRSTTSLVTEFVFRVFGMPLLAGWTFMLGVGVAHHEWLPALPTVGFADSILIVLLFGMAGRAMWGERSSSDN